MLPQHIQKSKLTMEPGASNIEYSNSLQYFVPTYGVPYPRYGYASESPLVHYYKPVEFMTKPEELATKDVKISAVLQNEDMWELFDQVGNEMMVTKQGR